MSLRLDLYDFARHHAIDADAFQRLRQIARLDDEPEAAAFWLPRIIAVLGAALAGFGIIIWIAANWQDLGRFGRFALLEGAIAALAIGALLRPASRAPLALLAMLGIGGLFAYFGQTYQTGADPWQLFALWAALALPLCLAVKSDVLWAPFALIAMTGIALWVNAHTGHRFRVDPEDLRAHGIGWIAAVLLCAARSPALSRFTGAGVWAMRTAVTLAIVMITTGALVASLGRLGAMQYWLGIMVLVIAVAVFSLRETFDIYALSAAALSLNTLLVVGIAHLLLKNARGGDNILMLLLVGLIAAGLLGATVSGILRLSRARAADRGRRA
jgi:uncharacterized membrane protein